MDNSEQIQKDEQVISLANGTKITLGTNEFVPTTGLKLTTTEIFAKKLNAWFGSILSDYDGCSIELQNSPNNPLTITMVLKDKGEADGRIKCVKQVTSNVNNGNTVVNQVAILKALEKHRTYDLTDEFKDFIGKFINGKYKDGAGKVRWNQVSTEVSQAGYYGSSNLPLVVISGIDIIKVLIRYFGKINEDGSPNNYKVSVRRMIPGRTKNFVFGIEQLSARQLEEVIGVAAPNINIAGTISYIHADEK